MTETGLPEMENNAALATGAGAGMDDADPVTSCRVLVIEEDPAYLATITQIFQRHGYPVTAKASPEEGLRALRENLEGFDLVMTQPGIDGFELLKHTRESHPVVLFSDYLPREMVIRALIEGASDILANPLYDKTIRNIWQHVVRWNLMADSGAMADANQGDTDKGNSGGSQQQNQGMATNKTNFNSSPQQHRGMEDVEIVDPNESSGEHVPPPCHDKSTGGRT